MPDKTPQSDHAEQAHLSMTLGESVFAVCKIKMSKMAKQDGANGLCRSYLGMLHIIMHIFRHAFRLAVYVCTTVHRPTF
jgi:hypothetical protein